MASTSVSLIRATVEVHIIVNGWKRTRDKSSAPLVAWIDDAIDSELIPIIRFACVLGRDIDAVNNAIELPWSNGQAEGQINHLKTLKRECTVGQVLNC
jgi:transposase